MVPFVLVGSIVIAQAAAPAAEKGVRLEQLTWVEAETLLRPETVVVIPLGAAAKEHGPHLKLSNDQALAGYLTRRVTAAAPVVVAPTLPYHYYPAFADYPGSTSLALATARDLTTDVVRSLARSGPRRFYVLNTGISTAHALEAAAAALAAEGILLRYTDLAHHLARASRDVAQQEGGSHADEIETSMMLYIDADAVDMSKAARDFAPASRPFRLTRSPEGPGTYSPTGIWGDATRATKEKGRVIVEALVASVLDDIEQVRSTVPPSRTAATPARRPPTRPAPITRPSVARASTCTAGDERAIRAISESFSVAWNNRDYEALGGLWTRDGDIIHPDGWIERGAQAIMENRRELFTRREYRNSRHPLTLGIVRCLTADVAVADGKWELRDVTDSGGSPLPRMDGLVTLVVKRNGGWQIEAYRYTVKPPSGSAPPLLLKRPGYPSGQ